ncbi:MAG: hypothetical protein AB8B87_02375 [Granulosicoccus sp.]
MDILRPIKNTFLGSWPLVVFWGVAFAFLFQLLQLALLILRFGDLPNYVISYDWISHVLWIIRSTPAVGDMLPIIFEEWWIEIGFMNYDYGNGISEWSLNIIPSRMVMLMFMGGMITLLVLLSRNAACRAPAVTTATAAAGLGTVLMGMTSAAMSWVVCCATPSWVVGLAMLGLGVSTSLALEDLGPTLFGVGLLLLTLALVLVSRSQAKGSVGNVTSEDAPDYLEIHQHSTLFRRI